MIKIMKELTIEEKAERYDEAVEGIQEILSSGEDSIKMSRLQLRLQGIFPELKESEDERIRKEMIFYFTEEIPQCSIQEHADKMKEFIAWLEKQGEKKPVPDWMPKFLDELRSKKNCFDWDENKDIEGRILAVIEWMNSNYFNGKDGEQKPTDKIEPKFHEGDWIVFNGLALYIKEVVKGYYRTISKGGITNSYDWDIDNVARLWTIQDAKDGDVLVDRYNNIGIFLQYLCINWCSQIYLDCNGELRGFCLGGSHEPTGTRPATKEQCDILFKKMKEKGFEWDAENKWVKMF